VTAMERSILAELSERGGRGQLSRLKDRRPLERLVNKGFVERHVLKGQQEEYVLTAIGKKVRSRSGLPGRAHVAIAAGHERIEAVRATVQLNQRRTNLPPVRPGRLNS
jgi:hypothetical protein